MQTFLPYSPVKDENGNWSFRNSSAVLDNKRLNKQTVEASQILNILCGKSAKWEHHPAVLQWKGFEWGLLEYLRDFCLECLENRHFKNSIYDKIIAYRNYLPVKSFGLLPPWLGNEDFHASHRSRLLFKGRCDVIIAALKKHLSVRNWAQVKFWLVGDKCPVSVSNQLVKTNVFTNEDARLIENWLVENEVPIGPNHYVQFNWQEPDDIPYVWPVTIEKLRAEGVVDK